jgi:acetoin utilization deacetylase AcuC-like enzyme
VVRHAAGSEAGDFAPDLIVISAGFDASRRTSISIEANYLDDAEPSLR